MKFCFLILIILITSCGGISDSTDELSNNYYFASESRTDNIIVSHGYNIGDRYIPCNVIEYDYNDDYIIAKQQPASDCFWGTDNNVYGNETYYFWIIVHRDNRIIGPLSFTAYQEERAKLHLPKGLSLKKENY